MHLAVAEKILQSEIIGDRARFRLGCILPDAKIDSALRAAPHFQRTLPGGLITCGLRRYLELFGEKMMNDSLYLGYYLHLIQDMVYRRYMYALPDWDARVPENIQKLHSDYRKINRYIIETRHLENTLLCPDDFYDEEINRLFNFDIVGFLLELQKDFELIEDGKYHVFTPEMAEEYIALAAEACLYELKALREGLPLCDEDAMAWGKE